MNEGRHQTFVNASLLEVLIRPAAFEAIKIGSSVGSVKRIPSDLAV